MKALAYHTIWVGPAGVRHAFSTFSQVDHQKHVKWCLERGYAVQERMRDMPVMPLTFEQEALAEARMDVLERLVNNHTGSRYEEPLDALMWEWGHLNRVTGSKRGCDNDA